MALPKLAPHASTVGLRDGTAVYDEHGHKLVMLNSSASAVWERCDGATTVFLSLCTDAKDPQSRDRFCARARAQKR